MRSRKSVSGVITILISLMMVGILSLGTMVIEAGRLQAAKTQLAEANISAATSMIAGYDTVLYERYGLLAIDENLSNEARCRDYILFNSDFGAGYSGINLAKMYRVDTVDMTGMYNLTYPGILKRQILTRAKYNVDPTQYAFNYYNIVPTLSGLQENCRIVKDRLEEIASGQIHTGEKEDINTQMAGALQTLFVTLGLNMKQWNEGCNTILNDNTAAILPSSNWTGTADNSITAQDVENIHNTVADVRTVLGEVGALNYTTETIPDVADVNTSVGEIDALLSTIGDVTTNGNIKQSTINVARICVEIAQEIDEAIELLLAPGDNQAMNLESNLLLNSYIAEYFSNRTRTMEGYMGPASGAGMNEDDANFVSACTEYVFGGKRNELENQGIAYDYIAAIRLMNNLASFLPDSLAGGSAYTAMAYLAWGYYETCIDMELLTNYKADIPLYKYSLNLPLHNPGLVKDAFSSGSIPEALKVLGMDVENENLETEENPEEEKNPEDEEIGTTYRDYLALGLWLVPNSHKLPRIADIVQLEMRYREAYINQQTPEFLMSNKNTFCRVKVTASLNSILPVISVGSDSKVDGTKFQSIKYVGY
ncbi:MAG: hypothetical protein IJB84_07730 [Lachnospiraceae bacterium]|nr:hypothetical protein [Lachnospiraceae bacterium]